MPNRNRKFCPDVEAGAEKFDNKEDSSSMAKNDDNADSGSPSLSEEENNISEQTPSERPTLVVDLNIPLQHDSNEPGGGVVNYGFEFGENRQNDCAEDSKPLAKDKYVTESADHRYSAALLGKVLNTSCDTEIAIPEDHDPNMNCNLPKTRLGNAKNKENHITEKIPLEEVTSTVVPIISDNCEKALEAQKEYSASQNGGKDVCHDRAAGVNTDKLNQQNNGKRFEEYFMPANTHKKFLRGEKLYLTKEKEVAACSGWKLAIVCGSLLLVTLGVLLGVLAGVGVLVKEPATVMKGSSLPNSASMSAEAKRSNELPLSSLPITMNPNSPSLQSVPKVLIVELTLANESFGDKLLNSSKEYISLVSDMRKLLTSKIKNLELNSSTVDVYNSSITARFVASLQSSEISENNTKEIIENYFKQSNNMFSSYYVRNISVWFTEKLNTCLKNNGNCSHECNWNWRNYSQTCFCPSNFILSDDSKTCLRKQLGNDKTNGISTDTMAVPKMTEAPTTHSSELLVTNVDSTMPNVGSSNWTSVSEPTTMYNISSLKDSESLVTNIYNSVFNTEHSRTSYGVDYHEVDISNTAPNENKILELSTEGRADYTSDLATLKSKTEEKYGWTENNNLATTTEKYWPMIINLTDTVEVTSIYNSDSNTLDTLSTVKDSQFGQPVTRYTTVNAFSNAASSETSLTVGNSSVFEETPSLFESIENNVTNATDDEESVTYDSVTKVTSMEMFTDAFDQNTTGSIKASDTATIRADVSTKDNISEVLSTDSSQTNTNWDSASSVTTASAIVYSGFTTNTDSYNQTTILPLILNLTNSANLSDSTSPLYVTSTQHTAVEQGTLSSQNVTKEHTFTSLSSKLANSSEAILYTIESTPEEITDSEVSTTSNPNVTYGSNENVTVLTSTLTNSSDFLSIEQSAGEKESTAEISINFDIPYATLPSEEVLSEGKTSFNDTTELLYLTTSTNDTVYHEDGDIINGYTVSNELTIVQNVTNLHTSNNTEVSTTVLPAIATVVKEITEVSGSIQSSTMTDFNDITSHASIITELSSEASSTIAAITDRNENLKNDFPFTVTDTSNATTDSMNNFSPTEISDTTEIPETTISYAVTDSSNTEDLRNYLTSAITGVNNFTEMSINNLTFADIDNNNDTKNSSDGFHLTVTNIDNVTEHPGIMHSATTENVIFEGDENISTITDTEKTTPVTEAPRNISFTTEDSRNDSYFAGTVSNENFTMEYVQTKGILHEIEETNASTTEPHVDSTFENPVQDTDEVTSNITSTVEITSTLSTDSTETTEYTYDANNFTTENDVFDFNVSVDPNYPNSVQSMDFTTYSDHFDTNTSNVDTSDNSTISSSFLFNSTEVTTTMETGQASKLSFGDLSNSQLNETKTATLDVTDGESNEGNVDINIYIQNENSSLNYDNFTSDIFNQSDFEVATVDGFDSNTENENQTDDVNVTQPSVESAKIAMNGTSSCSEGMFPCSDGITCLDLMEQCDGVKRCPDGSDESQCEEDCGLNFRCINTSLCISASAKCDSIWDCEDGSDEDGCEPTSCEVKEVMCSDGSACIKPADICNEQYNCRDKSDEVGCVERTTCDTTNRFFCPEGLCIPLAQVCDAVQDCRNGEDEANCSCTGSDVFQCSNSVCLTKDVFCNGKEDCQDGSDERGCVQVDENGVVQVYDHNNQTWKVLCAEDWSENEGDFVCQDLGFGSASEAGVLPVSTNIGWMRRNNYTADNSTLWTLGMEPVDFCLDGMAAAVKCKEYSCGGTRTPFRRKRESGGQDTLHLPGQWTSLVLLYSSKSNKTCHGVVISPLWVLTSSQCLISHFLDFTDLSVRAGILTSNERVDSKQNGSEPQERNVQEVVIHPHSSVHRSPALRDYDVALIRTREPFKLDSNVNAICLGEEEIQEGITCFTGSFRNQNKNEIHTASSLSHLAVSVTDRNSCNSTEHYSKSITNRMICGQTTGTTSLCNNDDAVPLMCLSTRQKYHVAGMLSYQHNCGVYLKQPAVFSNINDMRPFIETMIGKYRYRVPYDGSLYFEATESSTTSESNSTLDTNVRETTLQTELLVTTDTMPDIESTDITTLTQISDFTLETNSTILSENNSAHVSTAVMTEAYLLNETEHVKNMTSEGLEDRSNKTVSLASNADVSQEYETTTTDAANQPENISSTYFTSIAPSNVSLLGEINLTVPSVQELNNTDNSDTKEERVANYESASVTTITLIPENITGAGKTDQETALSLSENQIEDNVNTSRTVNSFLVENTTWPDATPSVLDTTTPYPTSEVLNIDTTVASVNNSAPEIENNNSVETHTNNPITDISAITQRLPSQSHSDSIHLAHISQPNTSAVSDMNEHILKSEYESTSPTVTQDPIEMTILVNIGVTEESSQSPESLITAVSSDKNEDMALFVRTENSTTSVYSTLTASSDNFDITASSLSNSTFANTDSESSLLSFETSTYPSTASDVATTISIANITKGKESNFQTVDEISMNSTITESGLMKEEVFSSVQNRETDISREGFDKSISLSTLQEYYNVSSLNYSTTPENTTSESSISEDHLTRFSYECGTEDLGEANATSPYIGILKENVTCLASIISSKWVIASHHCLLSGASSNGTAWTFLKGHFHSAIKNILVHPQSEELGIDVALLELDDNLENNSSVCLPKHNMTSQHHCKVVRIENIEDDSKIIYTPVTVEPVMNCDIFYNRLSVQNICINNTKQTCQDNRTQLMCINDVGQWQLQGISSIKQCEDNSTSVYIDITTVVPWIENSVVL